MKLSQNEAAIMESWRRCAGAGLSPDSANKLYPLTERELLERQQKYAMEIAAFRRAMSDVRLPGSTAFLLVTPEGLLVEKNSERGKLGAA